MIACAEVSHRQFQDDGKGGLGLRGVAFMTVLTVLAVLAVLESTLSSFFMRKSPESEILAKFFTDMGEKCGEKMAKIFADFRPSISRKSGRKHFTKNWRQIRLAVK